jgi:hypothetical protein
LGVGFGSLRLRWSGRWSVVFGGWWLVVELKGDAVGGCVGGWCRLVSVGVWCGRLAALVHAPKTYVEKG